MAELSVSTPRLRDGSRKLREALAQLKRFAAEIEQEVSDRG